MIPVTENVMPDPRGTPDLLRVHPRDDVLIALREVQSGATVRSPVEEIVATTLVPRGHKLAATAIKAGAAVHKYGWPIGRATRDIAQGEHVHTHNLATALTAHEDYSYTPSITIAPPRPAGARPFLGYPRRDGRVETRNELWVLCPVG